MNDYADGQPLVIDAGSGLIKAGFAGDDVPRCMFPSVLGYPKRQTTAGTKEVYVGDEVTSKLPGYLTQKWPIEHGLVTNWEEMERIWHHVFYNQLCVAPEDHRMLLTEVPLNARANREKMTQIMFETYTVPAMFIQVQAILALYASGRTTGLILDSGEGSSYVVPVYEGFSLPHAISRFDLSGRDISQHLQRLLAESGTPCTLDTAREIKERFCYVAQDFQGESASLGKKGSLSDLSQTYETPDGQVLTVSSHRFIAPECYFQPALGGLCDANTPGVQHLLHEAAQKCDVDIRRDLYQSLLLSGGSTMVPGLPQRLEREVQGLVGPLHQQSMMQIGSQGTPQAGGTTVRCVAPPERKYSVWVGGSILASLGSFGGMWVTKEEYVEAGASIVHRKCGTGD
eukprot:gnl/Trimastix_PCT/3260.p1 GENE.gnl/Trimastix_PCT/3260~~gnl/Trimastix_PCT/3260.p1  ORF type:complete len:399 (+),score=81.37 gnl/Trimastix_PCT/3260:82-1278(+)